MCAEQMHLSLPMFATAAHNFMWAICQAQIEKKDQLTLSNQRHVNTKFKYLPRDNKLRHWWFLLCYNLVDKPVGFKYCF